MEILYKSKNAVVVYKPPLVSSQSDTFSDADAMTLTSHALSEMGESDKLWLIHRLDKVVGGLMIFARNQRSAAELSRLVADNQMNKEYLAVAEGIVPSGILEDYLYKDSLSNKAFVVKGLRKGVKQAVLKSDLIASAAYDNREISLVDIKLHTGRFHQIRAQLSSRGNSILGDKKYGSKDFLAKTPALFAYHLSIKLFNENIDVIRLPDTSVYPWSLFEKEIKEVLK